MQFKFAFVAAALATLAVAAPTDGWYSHPTSAVTDDCSSHPTGVVPVPIGGWPSQPTSAVPAPTNGGSSQPTGGCSTGPQQCCQQTMQPGSYEADQLLNSAGITLGDVTGLLGLQCTSIAGSSCNAQSVCCEDNSSSLVSIGCVPIQL